MTTSHRNGATTSPATPHPADAPPTPTGDNLRALAARASPDPFPDQPASADNDSPTGRCQWIYAAGQYELGLLHRIVHEGHAANRFVHYTDNFGAPDPLLVATHDLTGEAGQLDLHSTGQVEVHIDGQPLKLATAHGHRRITVPAGHAVLSVRVRDDTGPATFAVDNTDVLNPHAQWRYTDHNGRAVPAQTRTGGHLPPHLTGEPVHRVTLAPNPDGLFDLGAPALAHILLPATSTPATIRSGESTPEALSEADDAETRHDLDPRPDGRWQTRHQLGLRYLRVSTASERVANVVVEASVRPAFRRGAFTCSDDQLNRIWSTAAYTLRTCMHGLMLDGIKRDRMPWAGDQSLSTLANAFAFGDGQIVRDSLTALGQPSTGYINGISDYSLWWVINQRLHQLYFDHQAHLHANTDRIDSFVAELARHATADGIFHPPTDPAGFGDASAGSVFIDWGVTVQAGRDHTALQMLWFWALSSAAEVLTTAAHPAATRWAELAATVENTLQTRAWDPQTGAWTEYLGPSDPTTSYANFLAVLAGVTAPGPGDGIADAIEHGHVGTPFMTAFALRALAQIGRPDQTVDRIRTQWGAMLDVGARTFWEEFGTGDQPYAMYGRRFGKSLCHAWGAGPAALLPETVLGLRPLTDGWTDFEANPRLGDLTWAAAAIPVPHSGDLVVTATLDSFEVQIPAGTSLHHQGTIHRGPDTVTIRTPAAGGAGSPRSPRPAEPRQDTVGPSSH